MLFILLALHPCAFCTYLVFLLSPIALMPQELFNFLLRDMFLGCQQKNPNQNHSVKGMDLCLGYSF